MWDHEPRDHCLVVIVRCEISEPRSDSGTPSHGGRISAILVLEYLFELIQLDLQRHISHGCYNVVSSRATVRSPSTDSRPRRRVRDGLSLLVSGSENELPRE